MRAYLETPGLLWSDHDQEVVRTLRPVQDRLAKHLVLTFPNSWFGALKNAIEHSRRIVRIKSPNAVEPDVSHYLRPSANCPVYQNARSVVEGSVSKSLRIVVVFSETTPPHTPEPGDRRQHKR